MSESPKKGLLTEETPALNAPGSDLQKDTRIWLSQSLEFWAASTGGKSDRFMVPTLLNQLTPCRCVSF